MWSLKIVYHFLSTILSQRVPVCAAISFFRSPIVSSGLHLTRTFFPNRSLQVTSNIMMGGVVEVTVVVLGAELVVVLVVALEVALAEVLVVEKEMDEDCLGWDVLVIFHGIASHFPSSSSKPWPHLLSY